MSTRSWDVDNFNIFRLFPKEIVARIVQYLIEPQFNFSIEKETMFDANEEFDGIILALRIESKIFMPNSYYENIYGIDECIHSTCVRHNINFMSTNKDIMSINKFIHNIRNNTEGLLMWSSPRYSRVQEHVLTYIPNETPNIKPKLISQIYQLAHEQYYPPSPLLLYNVDLKHGKFKSIDCSFNLSKKDKNDIIKSLLELIELVQKYA